MHMRAHAHTHTHEHAKKIQQMHACVRARAHKYTHAPLQSGEYTHVRVRTRIHSHNEVRTQVNIQTQSKCMNTCARTRTCWYTDAEPVERVSNHMHPMSQNTGLLCLLLARCVCTAQRSTVPTAQKPPLSMSAEDMMQINEIASLAQCSIHTRN